MIKICSGMSEKLRGRDFVLDTRATARLGMNSRRRKNTQEGADQANLPFQTADTKQDLGVGLTSPGKQQPCEG